MTPAEFDVILAEVATHGNVRRALRDRAVSFGAFYDFVAKSTQAAEQYARAKELGLNALADEILELADVSREGRKRKETKDGTFEETGDNVERSRLQIESRKWLLAKLMPSKYGDSLKLDANVKGGLALTIHTKPKEPDA